jgi:hypothetical protein
MLTFDEKSHTYTLDGRVLPSVTRVLRDAGLIDARWFDEAAAWRGSCVHQALEFYDQGDLNEATLDSALRGYLDGWRKFLVETGFEITGIEMPVADATYGYAGRLDRRGVLAGTDCILDIKSGASVAPATALQLAAYACASDSCGAGKDSIVLRRLAVRLPGDGTYKMTEYRERTDWHVFAAALAVLNWKRNHNLEG